MVEVKFEDHILLWSFDEFKKIHSGLGSRIGALFRKTSNEERLKDLYERLKSSYELYRTYFNALNTQGRCKFEYEDGYNKRFIISADRTETLEIEGSINYKKVKEEKKTLIPVSQNKNKFNLILDYFLQEKLPSEGTLNVDYKFKSIIDLGTKGKFHFTRNPKKMDGGFYDDDRLYFGEPGKVYFRHIPFYNSADRLNHELLYNFSGHLCCVNQRKDIGLNGTLSIDDKLVFAGTFNSDGWWPFFTLKEPKPKKEFKVKKPSEYENINPKKFSIGDYKTV